MTPISNLRELLPKVRALLRDDPTVVGVGLGTQQNSRLSNARLWRIYVSHPSHGEDILLGANLPKSIFGLPTQLCHARRGRATSGTVKVYTAGMQIETYVPSVFSSDPQGSLGCFALDSNQKPVLLTCSHVLFPGFHAIPGLAVYQPDYSSCCSGGDKIATPVFDATQIQDGLYKGGFKTQLGSVQVPAPNAAGYTTLPNQTCSETDCAIASLDLNPNTRFRNVWTTPSGEISIGGVNNDVLNSIPYTQAGTTPQSQSYVRVFSPMTNSLIYGTLTWFKTHAGDPDGMSIGGTMLTPLYKSGISDSPTDDESAGTMPSLNQFLILPRPAPIAGQTDYTKFYNQPNQVLGFSSGDSGSVVIDYQGRVIAQIVRKLSVPVVQFVKPGQESLIEFTSVSNFGVASPIQGVLDQLKITIPNSFDQSGPSGGTALGVLPLGQPNPAESEERRAIARLREGLLESRRGRLLIGKIGQHRREVRGLFARVRAVSSAWRELQGGAWYHEVVRNARNPRHCIPRTINGVSREQLVATMAELMMRYGSPELRRVIGRHARWATPMLLQVSTLGEVPNLVAGRRETA